MFDLALIICCHTVAEVALAKQLLAFHDTLESVVENLMPHHLCEYLYNTSSLFSDFFRDCKVVGDPKQRYGRDSQLVANCVGNYGLLLSN